MVGEGLVGEEPLGRGSGPDGEMTLQPGPDQPDQTEPTSPPADSTPPPQDPTPPPPTDPTPPPGTEIAQEGQGCWQRTCFQGLACVAVYQNEKIIGKFCMERCATLGNDPGCDGGEQCTKSKETGLVCFNPNNPSGGYTSNSPGANPPPGGQAPPPDGQAPTPPPTGGACGGPEESQVFTLLNQVRGQHGLAPLQCDLGGAEVARNHSQDMCNRGYFSHYSPDGRAPWDRLSAAGVQFYSAGENIAMGYPDAQTVHNGWMNSPGHRQNMLDGGWMRVGIGRVICGGTPYWTEVFMQ